MLALVPVLALALALALVPVLVPVLVLMPVLVAAPDLRITHDHHCVSGSGLGVYSVVPGAIRQFRACEAQQRR